MLSKIFNNSLCGLFKTQPVIISTGSRFSTSTTRNQSQTLRNKILSINSLDEFNNFFKDKKQQFDPSCYSIASRALAKIIIESKPIFNFQNRESIKAYLTHLQKVDIEALSLQQFSQLLYLLRVIKIDPNNSNSFAGQFIKSILQRSESKLKELEQDNTLSRLSYFYQEFSSLGGRQSTIVAKRINQILQNNNSEVESQLLNINQINLILKGMRYKSQLSSDELTLLRVIIKTVVQKHFDKLSFLQLAQISVGINEVVSSNSEMISSNYAEQIHKKVLVNIDEMDEKSIMHILNAKKTDNRTYFQIYKNIFDKILDEIQPNGESSFNDLFTLRLFNGISDKIRLSFTNQENQDKFFAFLRQTLTKTPRFIHSFVENYVQKGFFNFKHLLRLQEILESIPDFNCKLTLLYQLSKKNINVEKLLSIKGLEEIELRDKNLIMMATVIEDLSEREGPNKEKFVEILSKVKGRFFQLYKVEDESFSNMIFKLDNQILISFYKIFRKEIQTQFPNPFETEQAQKYRMAWLKIYIHGCNQAFFLKKLNFIKDKLAKKDFQFLFRTIAIDRFQNKDTLSNVLSIVSKRLEFVITDDKLLSSLGRLLSTEISSIFETNSNERLKNLFWHILNDCFEKVETSKFMDGFSGVINRILKSNIYHLQFSSQYQIFLIKLLQKADSIKGKYLVSELLEESLKLNLIKRQHIPTLSSKLTDIANNNQKLLLKMIESNQFALEGVELNKRNLYLFLFNLSPQSMSTMNKNQQKVLSIIEEMKPREIWKCITHYRLGSKKSQSFIFDSLFKQINKSTLLFEQYSPILVGEVLRRNKFDKFFSKVENVKTFYKNALEYFTQKRNIQKIPLEDHIQLIKSANDFKVRNDQYIHAVFDDHIADVNIWKRELYLVAGTIGLELNKKEIQKLIDHNFFVTFASSFSKCFNIFLYFEKQLDNPATFLSNLINKYNQLKANEKVPVYASHYEYLRKVYPEETKNFEPNHLEKADFCRSLESLNSKALKTLRQTIEEITSQKFVENNIAGNYYYMFRNVALVFPFQSKNHGENNLIKKILTTLSGVEKIVIFNKRQTNVRSAIKFLTQSYKDVLTMDEQEKIIKKLDQKFEQLKETLEQGEVQEAEKRSENNQIK